MRRSSVWQRLSHSLAVATELDFQTKALPVLRLCWPSLVQTPNRRTWDEKGIDLLVWEDQGPFPCCVQCKGFHVQNLSYNQIRQAEESIDKFLASDVTCDTYLLVHNRDGRHKEFNTRVRQRLDQVVSEGKAMEAHLWDRQTLLNRAFDWMKTTLDANLHQYSEGLLRYFQSLFRYGHYYIPTVPIAERRLVFKRGEPCSVKKIHEVESLEVGKLLLSASETRWTLLAGMFGFGKSTAVLHAATSSDRVVIFVRCATLPVSPLATSTNMLLEEIVKSLHFFEESEYQDLLCELAGPTLATLLRNPNSPYALILDGLDENRVYSNLTGLQLLSNQLAELTCPIVLTTRTEHLSSMFGDFSSAFYEFSTKNGPGRGARLLELGLWEKEQVIQLVSQAESDTRGVGKRRLQEFLDLVKESRYEALYGQLPLSPLFLQFILEDVVEHGVRKAARSLLIRSWVERKIRRDRALAERISPERSIDMEDFVARMIKLMENIAGSMISRTEEGYDLTESISSDVISEKASQLFNVSGDPILGVLLNSALVPVSRRCGSSLDVAFAFKVIQECFLGAYLVRRDFSDDGYPNAVESFYSEIALASG